MRFRNGSDGQHVYVHAVVELSSQLGESGGVDTCSSLIFNGIIQELPIFSSCM